MNPISVEKNASGNRICRSASMGKRRMIYIELTDGRIVGFPGDRFNILKNAPDEQLKDVKLRLNGFALR